MSKINIGTQIKPCYRFQMHLFGLDVFSIQEIQPLVYKDYKWQPITIQLLDVEDTSAQVFSLIENLKHRPVCGDRCEIRILGTDGATATEKYEIVIKEISSIEFSKFSYHETQKINRIITIILDPATVFHYQLLANHNEENNPLDHQDELAF